VRYLSVCSGIEAATVAWRPLGWTAWAFAEVAAFPLAVLAHNYPEVPNLGDMTQFKDWPDAEIDLLVGGTPCQSFSVAGLRAGLADPRGSLLLTYLAIADRYRPKWLVWENVPGVLSVDGGRAFSALLGGLAKLGYGFAYRVLDAQYFGLAQRRKRVFVVGHLGDWRRAAAVLFERASLCGDSPPRREAGESTAAETAPSLTASGRGVERTGESRGQDPVIAHVPSVMTLAIRGRGDSSDLETREDGLANAILTPNGGRGGIGVGAIAFSVKDYGADAGDLAPTLRAGGHHASHANGGVMPAIAFQTRGSNVDVGEVSGTLGTNADRASGGAPMALRAMQVRRLTPRECCRLQGFPDDYLDIITYRGKPAADGPKYKALGNSFAVPVVRWIGERIQMVDAITEKAARTP
jgi:DNA (cytosine-5)-methyltransferase 1